MTAQNESVMQAEDIQEILKYLPHRYPFLLLDRIIEYRLGDYLVALKNVSYNEPFFTGHFPGRPIMPGVLILEAMAQAAGILAFKTTQWIPNENSLFYFGSIDQAKFKQPVIPGDQLKIKVKVQRAKGHFWKFNCVAEVEDRIVCEADIMCARKDLPT